MVSPIIALAIAGGAGGGIANIALSPANSGASLLNSYWYGAGLILGERDMYTFHWEKIKKRLEGGEDYLTVLESEMNPAITAISAYSLQIMAKTTELYKQAGVNFLVNIIEDLLNPFYSGPQSELLRFTATEIAGWTDTELRSAFENKTSFALYTNFTQTLIEAEYNKRFVDTEPIPEPDPVPDPISSDLGDDSEQSRIYLESNSIGRVTHTIVGGNATWRLYTRQNNAWAFISPFASANVSFIVEKANASWPKSSGYTVFTYKYPDGRIWFYWIHDHKIP